MNPARFRAGGRRWHRVLLHLLVAVAAAAVVLIAQHDTGFPLFAALFGCAVLPWRYRWPRLVLLLCLPAVAGGLGWPPTIVASFALGWTRPYLRWLAGWAFVVAASALAPVLATQTLSLADAVLTVTFVMFIVTAPIALGALLETRQRLRDSLDQLRAATEAESAAKAETARAEERSRIAREIHDAVGHHVTLIAVDSAALGAGSEEPVVRETARRLRGLASEALNEMRVTLGLVASPSDRPVGLRMIPELVERVRETGIEAELVTELDRNDEPAPSVARAAYRVVQEALTNVSKHAPGAGVTVHLGEQEDALRVTVRNGAPTVPAAEVRSSSDRGLAGLSERVETTGGTLHAGPSEDGGYRLLAVLPCEHD